MTEKLRKKKIVLFTGYRCNNNCVFCIDSNKRNLPEKKTAELIKEIYRAKKAGADILEIIGGESTIRNDFTGLVRTAKKIGIPEVLVATNGRMFSEEGFCKKILKAGIDGIIFSVHGHCAELHDSLTRVPGSFGELLRGMSNLANLGFRGINGNTTVVKANMRHLGEIGNIYAAHKVRNVEFIFVDPTGGARDDFMNTVPRISRAAPFMRGVLDKGIKRGFRHWKVRYVPLCHFRRHLDHISDINERALFETQHWAPDFVNENAVVSRQMVSRRKTARCAGCRLYNMCEGIWTEYIKRYGDSELKAVRR